MNQIRDITVVLYFLFSVVFSGVAIRALLEMLPLVKDMKRSLAILRAEILINRRQRAREKIGGAVERDKHEVADFEELREKE